MVVSGVVRSSKGGVTARMFTFRIAHGRKLRVTIQSSTTFFFVCRVLTTTFFEQREKNLDLKEPQGKTA